MKASSESGLCATVISRTFSEELRCIEIVTLGYIPERTLTACPERRRVRVQAFYLQAATQTKSGCGGHCHFQKFSNQERIQTENCSALPTVRHGRQPTETSDEQYHLGNRTSHHVAHKSEWPALYDPSCHVGDHRICPQVTRRRTEQLGQASRTDRTKHWQAHSAPRQVQRGGGKTAPASQRKTDQQHSEVRQGQGNRGKGKR